MRHLEKYAKVFGDDSVFLIDTYGFEQGTRNAIKVCKELGIIPKGVRDDSGDLAAHSKTIRKMLDDVGFTTTKIIVSNDISETELASLKKQGAEIDLFGIGTKLVTAEPTPSLGTVYKLNECNGPKIKLSSNIEKATDPYRKQVYRVTKEGYFVGDIMAVWGEKLNDGVVTRHRFRDYDTREFESVEDASPLLIPIFRDGKLVYDAPFLEDVRKNTLRNLQQCWPELLRLENPAEYEVGLSPRLYSERARLRKKYEIRRKA